jgi:cytosine-specific methyltransferase
MPTVKQYITENIKRISHVKSLVKEKAEDLILILNSQATPLSRGKSWKDLEFSHPERTIRLGTNVQRYRSYRTRLTAVEIET